MPEFTTTVAERRTFLCAKHLVATAVFRESAYVSLTNAETSTLACIGYYYCAFHSALAALWVTETVPATELKRIKHAKVRKLVEQHLKQPKRIKAKFMEHYLYLQDVREKSNYQFSLTSSDLDYSEVAPRLYQRTAEMLGAVVPYIRNRLVQLDTLQRLAIHVGDGIGDDLIILHGGKDVYRRVTEYLVKEQFST